MEAALFPDRQLMNLFFREFNGMLWLMMISSLLSSVDEEELRRKVKEEMQERLGEEIHQKKQELQLQ